MCCPNLFIAYDLQCENCLKDETAKFQVLYQKFCKDKATHLQALKGILPHRYSYRNVDDFNM